ncbi:hypothetical protein [Rhodococcus qingshengii]|uniref:hypothetical protein n=1 Tax=Rhodococcus TaxID=1827 RepID=UPI002AFF649C|nr:hypothetical protein [Rhodococcus qingshengii]MEA1797593.1 hypothetical protein [Rhodococcus qingshengii]
MLADTAIAGRSSYVVLQVRRFLCSNSGCDRRTFVEQIDGLTKAYAQLLRCCAESSRRSSWRWLDELDRGWRLRWEFRSEFYSVAAGPSVARPSNRRGDGARYR